MAGLWFLGAGFSKLAGLPLGCELFPLLLKEARYRGLASHLDGDVQRFCEFKARTTGQTFTEETIDSEEFIAFLDVEHRLGFKGKDTWSSDGNRSQHLIRNLIAFVLWKRQESMTEAQWKPYLDFASQLDMYDYIISFNYDTIMERALEKVRKPFRLVPDRYDEVWNGGGALTVPDDQLVLLKVHGSIDWFDFGTVQRESEDYQESYGGKAPKRRSYHHFIFDNESFFKPRSIVGDPYPQSSPLNQVRRVRDLDHYFAEACFVMRSPLILAPSYQKVLYFDVLKEFWWGFNGAGRNQQNVNIIGFSLPPHDQYALQAVCAAVCNFQRSHGGEVEKGAFQMVDFCPNDEQLAAIQERYRFVDWSAATLHRDGFNEASIVELFENMLHANTD